MSTLGHVFEAHGLATVALALDRRQAEGIAPPRALYVEHPFGRPLGIPADVPYQRRVLDSAFELLPRTDGPLLVDFPDRISDAAELPLACPLPPRTGDGTHPAVDEARALRPAWERARNRNGGTQVGRVHAADDIPAVVASLVEVADGRAWTSVELLAEPLDTLMDLRVYYEEAALGLADHVPAARSADSWYYERTATGALIHRLQAVDPPFPGPVLPSNQRADTS